MNANHFYVAKILSNTFSMDKVRNFAVEFKKTKHFITRNQGNQDGFIEWGTKKIGFKMRQNNYLFIFTNKKEDILIVEKICQHMCKDLDLKLLIQEIPKGTFIGNYFSSDIIDFEVNEQGLQADLWIENEEISVVYDNLGYVTFSMTPNTNISGKVVDFIVDFLFETSGQVNGDR